jgi:heat shock protein HslJ
MVRLDAILSASMPPAAGAADAPTLAELEDATYRGLEEPKGPVTLVNGRWEGSPYAPGGAARPTVTFGRDFRVTGDLDGDGAPEAVVLLAQGSGGSGAFDYLAVVKKTAAGLENVATAPLGDRVQVRSARIEGRKLLVSVVQAGEKDTACCPGELVDREWTLAGRTLTTSASPPQTGRISLDTLAGTEWVLGAWGLDAKAPADPEVTLAYVGGRFAGKSGCNRYTAAATAGDTPGEVSIGPAAVTRMACPEPQSAVEARFLRQLGAAKKFGFLLGQLAITYEQDGRWDTLLFEGRSPAAATVQ